jgi:tetratricopeptide (TPR) repeat protein
VKHKWEITTRIHPKTCFVTRSSEKTEAKAAGQKGSEAWLYTTLRTFLHRQRRHRALQPEFTLDSSLPAFLSGAAEKGFGMSSLRILILSSCLLISNSAVGNVNSADQNNLKTAHDFYLSGNKFCRDGEYDKAIPAFIKSAELDPDYYYTHINLGLALAKTRQFDKAIRKFTLCISKKWGSPSDRFVFYFNRSLAAEASGDKSLALKDRAALEKLDPLRARKLNMSADYILMDVAYMDNRNLTDRDRLLNRYISSITKGKIVVRQVAKLEKTKQEYEAIGLIQGTLKQVSGVLADYEGYPKFMPDVDEIAVRISPDGGIIVDHKLGLPFGFIKKYRLKFHSKNEDGRTQISFKKLPWPGLKTNQTVVDTYGQWILEDFPDKDGHVLVYYRVYTDTGQIPFGTGWLVDPLTRKSIENTFKAIRKRVKDLYN